MDAFISPASRWSTPTTKVGVKLRHRQAQTPTRPLRNTKARDTKGRRNWLLHKSAQRENISYQTLKTYVHKHYLMFKDGTLRQWKEGIITKWLQFEVNGQLLKTTF